MKYKSDSPRIPVSFINNDTEETLFEINDRNWMTLGEIFSSNIVSSLIENEFKNQELPDKVMVIAVSYYTLKKD